MLKKKKKEKPNQTKTSKQILSPQEVEAEGLEVQGQLQLTRILRPH